MSNPLLPLHQKDIDDLTRLLQSLDPSQRLWVSGFVSGYIANGTQGIANPLSSSPSGKDIPLTILYGSQTGNAEKLAKKLKEQLIASYPSIRVESMAQYKTAQLKKEKFLILMVSTHGEGDPPDNAVAFHRFILGPKAPQLDHLRFAVLALGDSSYEHFCKTGIDFDQRLLALGAEPLLERADCDVDYEDAANEWFQSLDRSLSAAIGREGTPSLSTASTDTPSNSTYGRNHPYLATLIENIPLTAPGSSKEVRHIALSLAGSDIRYSAGDALGVIPFNWPERVNGLLDALNLYHADTVTTGKGNSTPLESALLSELEITTVCRPFIEKWALLSASTELASLLKPDRKKDLQQWLYGREIIDIVKHYPIRGLNAQQFVDLLRKIPPRLYSIASSWHQDPDEVDLTIGVVRYESHGQKRQGVASTFLSDRVAEGSEIRVYVHENPNFRLPKDSDRPIIMIGPGTGVAPFRAFLQEREALGSKGKNWLFFGDREFQNDFLYQSEWLDYRKKGLLNRLDVAFSRDSEQKVYVQHRLKENAKTLYAWIQEGAHIYICGDAKHMAVDVHQALTDVISKEGKTTPEQAEETLIGLQADGRYQRDVY